MNVIPSPIHLLDRARSTFDMPTIGRAIYGGTPRGGTRPQDFDVNPQTAFFPPKPLPHLPAEFSIWEEALANAPDAVRLSENQSPAALAKRADSERWRAGVRSWPLLKVDSLRADLRQLQRAHMVLAFILHYYAHSYPTSSEDELIIIPRSLAIPLAEVSKDLGFAPVLTFTDTVLWNWKFINPDEPLTVDNMEYTNLLSGIDTEANFYKASAAVELKGAEMLQVIEAFGNLADPMDQNSQAKILRDLVRLKTTVEELTETFRSIRSKVDPHSFYWLVRPWWVGAKTLSNGQPNWVFEGVPNYTSFDLDGPSAGQSAVMHALDIFLDVDHKLVHHRTPAPSEANKKADRGFMERMRRYMTAAHRDYLTRIGSVPRTVRQVAEATPSLREPYNAVVSSLKQLRDVHMQIATLYIITQRRTAPPASAGIVVVEQAAEGSPIGTGGNEVASLLKAGRDATRRTLLPDL
ncbi:hypothetical protein QCA50_003635 [Cerrena zonata]|uniref:Indoleamine 2,3-dioxygenase n=1 Tax=Cerrena zonata TaxID=2478898 RepID=A0AAW0GWT1_9APHY